MKIDRKRQRKIYIYIKKPDRKIDRQIDSGIEQLACLEFISVSNISCVKISYFQSGFSNRESRKERGGEREREIERERMRGGGVLMQN